MVPADFTFDPTDLNRKLGLAADRFVLASDAEFLWPLAHQLITCSQGQLMELLPEAPDDSRYKWKRQTHAGLHGRVVRLMEAGLVTRAKVQIEPHRRVERPLFGWKPGEPPPDGPEQAAAIASAWTASTSDGPHANPPSTVYRITNRGAIALGAFRGERNTAELRRYGFRAASLACAKHPSVALRGDCPRSVQAVSEIFLARLWDSPDSVRGWRLLHRTATALLLPDALVYDGSGKLLHAVVYATHWCACIVERFHKLCSSRGMAYQVYGA